MLWTGKGCRTFPFMTQVWLRDPWNYIREVVEANHPYVLWRPGTLRAKNIDPIISAELYFAGRPWEVLVSGTQGVTHYKSGDVLGYPSAVYPVYSYADDPKMLESLLNNPVGESKSICSDGDLPQYLRPVYGQDHRVFVRDKPNLTTNEGIRFLAYLNEMQLEFPEATIHLLGLNTFRAMFGGHFKSVDFNPRDTAQRHEVFTPVGRHLRPENVPSQDLNLAGFTRKQLEVPRERCIYNIKSAVWASEHYKDEVNYRLRQRRKAGAPPAVDDDLQVVAEPLAPTKSHKTKYRRSTPADLFLCNTCSLQNVCKLFREGSVCVVPGAEPVRLAKFFGTRDSDQIINGLSILVQGQMNRLESAMQDEVVADNGLDPEVSKELSRAFANGVKLAQLVDPDLRPGAKIQINNMNGNAPAVASANPAQLISEVVREFERKGIPRSEITNEMIENALTIMAGQPKAIEH